MADLSATATGRLVQNQPHDEEVALSEGSAEDVLMASSDTRGLGGGTEDSRDDLGYVKDTFASKKNTSKLPRSPFLLLLSFLCSKRAYSSVFSLPLSLTPFYFSH